MNKIIKINKFRWTTHRIQPITSMKISVLLQIILYIYKQKKFHIVYTSPIINNIEAKKRNNTVMSNFLYQVLRLYTSVSSKKDSRACTEWTNKVASPLHS